MKKIITEQQLFDYISNCIEISTYELQQYFSISSATLNRMLKVMREKNLILVKNQIVIYRPVSHFIYTDLQIEQRKNIIAKKVASSIKNNTVIGLSGGSTTISLMCPYIIMNKKDITIISNSIIVLKIFLDLHLVAKQNNVSLIILGGNLQEELYSFSGEYSKEILSKFSIECSYIGVESINVENNAVYTSIPHETDIDCLMMKHSQKNYIVCLKEKFAINRLYKWNNLSDFDGVFSDDTFRRYIK